MIAPFIMRIYALADSDVLPKSVIEGLNALPHFTKWTDSIRQEPSVLTVWDGPKFVARTQSRLERMKVPPQPKAQ
jgi:glutathione S-transferase